MKIQKSEYIFEENLMKKQMMEMIYDKLINEIRLINWLNASNS